MSVGEDLEGPQWTELMNYLIGRGEQGCVEDIFPYMQQASLENNAESHLMASNTLRTILQQKLVPPSTFTHSFVQSILTSMKSSDPVVAKAWLDTLLDVMELVPVHIVKSCILPVAISKGQLSQSVTSRVASCELLGKMATRFDSTEIEKEIVPLVHSLCQDVASEVRASMCRQLPVIAKGLTTDAVLLPLIVDLAIDEEISVRLAAVQAITDLLPHLKQNVIKDTIIPLLKRMCEEAAVSQDHTMCAIAKHYAHICIGLQSALSVSDKVYFLRFFKQLARAGLSPGESKLGNADLMIVCRHQCAFNFPAMVHFSGVKLFDDLLYPNYIALTCDPFHGVRRSIAAGIHEVMRLLGSKCAQLRPQLIALVNDSSCEVLQALVPNLSDALEQLARTESQIEDGMAHDLARALVNCERTLHQSRNWRAHAAILAQLECAPRVLPADVAHNQLTGLLLERVHDARPLPCRLAAARTLLILLRHAGRAEQRTHLRDRIIAELCNNRSCHSRLLFVKMCGMALDIFSSHYFKEHFFLSLLTLAGDPVANIRLLVCGLLPRLKMLLQLPQDSAKLALLDDAVHQLSTSKPDHDVSAELVAVRSQLDRITVRTESSVGHLYKNLSKAEQDDEARYEEEQKIAQADSRSRRLVTVNMKTLSQGKKPSLIAVPPIENSKRSSFHLSEPRRVSDSANILSSITSALNDCSLSERSGGLSKSTTSLNSAFPALREEDFYVDAGVSLTMVRSEMTHSSIPTVRDMLEIGQLSSKTSTVNSFASTRSSGQTVRDMLDIGQLSSKTSSINSFSTSRSSGPTVRDMLEIGQISSKTSTLNSFSSTRSKSLSLPSRPSHSVISLPGTNQVTKASSLPITTKTAASTKRYSHVLVLENKGTVPDLKVILGDKKPAVNRNSRVSVTVNNKPLSKNNTSVTVLNRRQQATVPGVNNDRRRVALSSIGVRPQSCIAVGSRSLSQESLRGGTDTTRSPRLSQIPRGAVSCHSSPGNSRASSPPRSSPRTPQVPGLVSRLPVRRDRLSMSK